MIRDNHRPRRGMAQRRAQPVTKRPPGCHSPLKQIRRFALPWACGLGATEHTFLQGRGCRRIIFDSGAKIWQNLRLRLMDQPLF
jgi:hypothetical protein